MGYKMLRPEKKEQPFRICKNAKEGLELLEEINCAKAYNQCHDDDTPYIAHLLGRIKDLEDELLNKEE